MILGSPFDIIPIGPPPPTDAELLALRVLTAVEQLQMALRDLVVPAPTVILPEPDLAEIVTAVNGLKPGPTAQEIADAIAATLIIPPPPAEGGMQPALVQALEDIANRLKGIGRQAYGGGTVNLNPGQTVNVNDPYSVIVANHFRPAGLAAGAVTITTTATTDLYVPATGMKPRIVRWSLTQPSGGGDKVATVAIGSKTIAVVDLSTPGAHVDSSTYEGVVNEHMTVTLNSGGTVHANVNGHDWS